MNVLILGNGKMGSLTAEVARERGHHVRILDIAENDHGMALTPENLRNDNVVIDFTVPDAVIGNIEGCARSGKSMVVGTTGWYDKIPRIREIVEKNKIGFLWGANFSIGVNLFLEATRAAAMALTHQYTGQIFERHHVHKKDAPSGTAAVLQRVIQEASGTEVEITSFREGEVVGMHELVLDSPNDTIYLSHNAKSRRGFADGAIRAAEWLPGKTGFFDFKEIWREL
jgi:4-hydroxy-tetrahydrodipicolinate reductase